MNKTHKYLIEGMKRHSRLRNWLLLVSGDLACCTYVFLRLEIFRLLLTAFFSTHLLIDLDGMSILGDRIKKYSADKYQKLNI